MIPQDYILAFTALEPSFNANLLVNTSLLTLQESLKAVKAGIALH